MIKSGQKRWAWNIACMGEMRYVYRILVILKKWDQWQALLNTVMNLRVQVQGRNFLE
jgi:hypothetical protein